MSKQVITTTVFGPAAESLESTFSTFHKVPHTELHAFVYSDKLPTHKLPNVHYHLVSFDPAFVSVRRDALFRRWTLPDNLGAEYALAVDATDAVCVQPLPNFASLLRGAAVAASPEWGYPVRISGQGFTSTYLNAGVTFWHLPSSRRIREEIVARGRACYRGPFDDQTALNEVLNTSYFDQLAVLPAQFNWRASYRKTLRSWKNGFRSWPRVDSLDGVYIYHNTHCFQSVARDISLRSAAPRATLPSLPVDHHPLSSTTLLWRRIKHRFCHV